MDINQVLSNTLSNDNTTRANAEQQLAQAAQQDFSQFLAILSSTLANEQTDAGIRQAAGIALKNAFSFRDPTRSREVSIKWLTGVDPAVKAQIKKSAIETFSSSSSQASQAAAQLVATIAGIELPRHEWPDLMNTLVTNVSQGDTKLKMSSLQTIGYICESNDQDVRNALTDQSNSILTAVVQGAQKGEASNAVRETALQALSDATEFIRKNFENEGERNYIMQVVCEATQSEDVKVQANAYGCLHRIMGIYYDKMRFYMEKALFGLTISGMRSEEEEIVKLAVEFWCTVCEEEISIEDDNALAQNAGEAELRPHFYFAKVAAREVVPVILQLMTRVDEDDHEDEYTVARAAYQCLQLYAQTIGSEIVPMVLQFVEANLRSEKWQQRDAAVASFGAIMDGPDNKVLAPLVKQALPVLINMMQDPADMVKDSAAYALSRVCDYCYDCIDKQANLPQLMEVLFNGLMSNPRMASSCCVALMNLNERTVDNDEGKNDGALAPHFQSSVTVLLQVTEKQDVTNEVRTAAYEVLGGFCQYAADSNLLVVDELTNVIVDRLVATMPMLKQIVSVDDRITLEEVQISLSSVLLNIVQRLESNIAPRSDRIMETCLTVLNSVSSGSAVPEVIFQVISGMCNALAGDFLKYMESFVPYLYGALGNQDAPEMCSLAIGLVGDTSRALEDKVQPYCDTFMNHLLTNLRSEKMTNQLKPAILQTFADIATGIGVAFEPYLTVVAQVLQQAAQVSVTPDVSLDMIEYIVSLRCGIADAWDGIIIAFKGTQRVNLLQSYAQSIFQFIQSCMVGTDGQVNDGLIRSCMGIIGDLGNAFPDGQIAGLFKEEWLMRMIKDVRRAGDAYSADTQNQARWARETVKRQSLHQGNLMMSS